MTEERAVLAGGCFWGVQDLIRRYDGVLSTRVGYTGAACLTLLIAITAHMPKQSRSSLILPGSAIGRSRILFPDSRPKHTQSPGQRRRDQLPICDLLHQ
jgi:hypothetical protein